MPVPHPYPQLILAVVVSFARFFWMGTPLCTRSLQPSWQDFDGHDGTGRSLLFQRLLKRSAKGRDRGKPGKRFPSRIWKSLLSKTPATERVWRHAQESHAEIQAAAQGSQEGRQLVNMLRGGVLSVTVRKGFTSADALQDESSGSGGGAPDASTKARQACTQMSSMSLCTVCQCQAEQDTLKT